MRTEDLIRVLAADSVRPVVPVHRLLVGALVGGAALSAALFRALLDPRPDISAAADTFPFLFKLAVMLILAGSAVAALLHLARPLPYTHWRRVLAIAPLLLAAGIVTELLAVPADTWLPRLVGHNATHCLSLIPLLSLAPAVCVFLALKRSAPAQPALAGGVAGLLAGAIGAVLYALTCPDDSALFVGTWYSIAIAIVTLVSAGIGRRVLRW
jgi:hypothetical protein